MNVISIVQGQNVYLGYFSLLKADRKVAIWASGWRSEQHLLYPQEYSLLQLAVVQWINWACNKKSSNIDKMHGTYWLEPK